MRKGFRVLFVLLALSVIQACSSSKVVKSYEGDVLSNEQLGLLVASENISIVSINGKDVPQYLLSSLETTYGLKPGNNKVVFIYESIWAKSGPKSKGNSKVEKVRSKELVVEIATKAGETYHFSFPRSSNVREAKDSVKDLKVSIYDSADVVAGLSKIYDPATDINVNIANNLSDAEKRSINSLISEKKVLGNPAKSDDKYKKYKVSNTEALKKIWAQMTAKEKKEFLVWAFQE